MSILRVLLIDDNPDVANALELAFRLAGHSLTAASDPQQAYSLLARHRFDAILLDLNYSSGKSDGKEGLACLARLLADDPSACVVVLTAHGGMRIAVTAMQAGARDFVVKPWNNAELIEKVAAAVAREPAIAPEPSIQRDQDDSRPLRLLGHSAAIEELRGLIKRVGPTPASVAIVGASGAGRTLVANMVHAASQYAGSQPVTVDLRDEAAWSVLVSGKRTVILRHIEQLDEIAQERLLASLDPECRPMTILGNVNALIPAAKRRLATVVLRMPSLAEREEDIPLLAQHFLEDAAERFGRPPPSLAETALAPLRDAGWPDEVRGLALAIERAVLLAEDPGLIESISAGNEGADQFLTEDPEDVASEFNLDRVERALIERALSQHSHNVSHAARALGLSRGALYRRMERHGL